MTAGPTYAYLHGFASSPRSKKAAALRSLFEDLGLEIAVPDLNLPSFSELSYAAMLKAVDDLYEAGGRAKLSLIGSSLGGYLAALYASRHPERVDRLILLCPGFRLVERWPRIVGEEWFAVWEKQGAIPIPDAMGTPRPVHYRFFEEARSLPPTPAVRCPTLILHGTRDETVPVQASRDYAASNPHVRLIELDADHAMLGSLDRIEAEVQRFFEIGGTTVA